MASLRASAARQLRSTISRNSFQHRHASSAQETAKDATNQASNAAKQATQRASDSAKEATKQASERTQAAMKTAQSYATSASASASKMASQVTSGASGLLGSYREPVLYNLAVGREIAKQVYIKEGLAPPTSIGEITQTYEQIYHRARDVNWWRSLLQNNEWMRFGVYALEAYGIFKIGEMVGRRHIVGYKLEGPKPSGHGH